MTPDKLTEPMLYVLHAISRGEVTQRPDWHLAPWRLSANPDYAHLGRDVTASVKVLFRRELARPSAELDTHNRRPAVITAAGNEQLSKNAHRSTTTRN